MGGMVKAILPMALMAGAGAAMGPAAGALGAAGAGAGAGAAAGAGALGAASSGLTGPAFLSSMYAPMSGAAAMAPAAAGTGLLTSVSAPMAAASSGIGGLFGDLGPKDMLKVIGGALEPQPEGPRSAGMRVSAPGLGRGGGGGGFGDYFAESAATPYPWSAEVFRHGGQPRPRRI